MNKKGPTAPLQILSGWKEVANYLGMGVRTVQRYEREMALPIRRPSGNIRGSVIAFKDELREWAINCETRNDPNEKVPALTHRTNSLGARFLLVDSEIALTFSGIALEATNPERKKRTVQIARKAYNTIQRLRLYIELLDADKKKLEANLRRLESELRTLGQAA